MTCMRGWGSRTFGADYATAHPLALEAARRALEVDPLDADAHAVLGNLIASHGDFARGKAELETALRLNTSSAEAGGVGAAHDHTGL